MEPLGFSAPIKITNLRKVDGAKLQIVAAIAALAEGNVVAAVTLAAAAEGMLPDLDTASAFRHLCDHPMRPPDLKSDWVTVLNIDRDWLKHPTPHLPEAITIDTGDAAFMVVRALSKLPSEHWSQQMSAFKVWYLDVFSNGSGREKFPDLIERGWRGSS